MDTVVMRRSCDGVECVFAFPTGARAIGRVGAHRFDAAGVSNAAPTGTVARKRRRRPHVTLVTQVKLKSQVAQVYSISDTLELVFTLSMYTVHVRYGCIL